MAGREKKPALLKKQMLPLIGPKEAEHPAETSAGKSSVKGDAEAASNTVPVSPTKALKNTKPKKPIKKNLKINFKAKAKNTKKLKLTKTLFKSNKLNLDTKNVKLLKNGIKNKRKPKISPASASKPAELLPPVLEPAVPVTGPRTGQIAPARRFARKRAKKATIQERASGSDTINKKQKVLNEKEKLEKSHEETVEDILNEVANELDIDLDYLMKRPKKNVSKKVKIESAIKPEDIKPKKATPKKLKPETSKIKKSIKKENLIAPFCNDITLDSAAQNVINNLDLNVTKTTRKKAVKNRRHSIEKIPAVEETQNDSTFEQPFVLFPSTRRSASPRSKRNAKIRKSIETAVTKRLNPYTTRSDSPARILRNGKHRKLRDSQLLDGLDTDYKKRRRLCSEYSGSEISKYSGYLSESDSSFSDMASLQENGSNDLDSPLKEENLTKSDLLKKEILDSIKVPENDLQNLNIKQISTKFTAILKRSLSTDTNQISDSILNEDIKPKLDDVGVNSFTDTNSNDVKLEVKAENTDPTSANKKTDIVKCDASEIKFEQAEELDELKLFEKIASTPSEKVPDKTLILDSMKLKFNDVTEEVEKRATRSSKRNLKLEEEREKLETVTPLKFYGTDPLAPAASEPKDLQAEELKPEEPLVLSVLENNETENKEIATETVIVEDAQQHEESLTEENKSEIAKEEVEENELKEELKDDDIILEVQENESVEELVNKIVEKLGNEIKIVEELQDENKILEEDESKILEIDENKILEEDEVDENKILEEDENKILEDEIKILEDDENKILEEDENKILEEDENKILEEYKNEIVDDKNEIVEDKNEIVEDKNEIVEDKNEILEDKNEIVEDKNEIVEEQENANKIDSDLIESMDTKEPESLKNDEMDYKQSENLETGFLTKLKETFPISDALEKNIIDESPTIVHVNVNVDSENKENDMENINNLNGSKESTDSGAFIEETPENQAIKENILSALGLQSLRAAEEAKQRDKEKLQIKPDTYTGTLKTVIKLNRKSDGKKRNPLKMTLQKSKSRNLKDSDGNKSDGANSKSDGEGSCYKVMKETGSSSGWRHGSHSSDTAGANRKSHYYNRSNMDGSSEHASDGEVPSQDGESSGTKALVIPEKASSFGIHPDRLCCDECAYCFGKFGLFDTPLHIAQIKSEERQKKILQKCLVDEIYLTRDSCLCDACYRHVDRRVNANQSSSSSSMHNKNLKRTNSVLSNLPRQNYCHVLGCDLESSHVLRRKWLMKMRKSVLRVINIDLDNPGLHSIPICSDHYAAVEHLMVCALCKRRLARNHIHYLGFELESLNSVLEREGIPVKLTDKPVVCKLCRYFATLLIKNSNDIKTNTANFFRQYKKRLLHFHDIEVMDEAEAEEPIAVPLKEKSDKEILKKKSKSKSSKNSKGSNSSPEMASNADQQPDSEKTDQSRVPSNSENGESRESSPSDNVDIETLVPNMILECGSDTEEIRKSEVPQIKQPVFKKLQIPESVRHAVEISKIMKINQNRKKGNVVERLGSNPSISVRQLFPGEEDLPLQGSVDFNTVKERTPEGWEKCSCTIQYDVDTKHLWQELQKPYGNQSSFLRHLILLEKYFRNGDLTLSPNASHHAVNYSVSVQNRLRAYDNIPTNSLPMQPLTMLPFNQVKKSQSGIITTKEPVVNLSTIINAANLPKNTPIPISSLNPNFLTQLSVRHKSPGVPPGLISLQPGTNRPVAPLVKMPQKFKLPIGTKWRPTLIPVNPKGVNPAEKRITGLVQVISGGKPYHISLADYNRMCYLKKTHEMKQKLAEAKLKQREPEVSASSVLKPVIPRKPKILTAATNTALITSPSGIVNKAVTVTAVSKDTLISVASSDVKNGAGDKTTNLLQEIKGTSTKSLMILPKIPKSLTVIPQTVPRKSLQPSSPTLSITTKPSTSKS